MEAIRRGLARIARGLTRYAALGLLVALVLLIVVDVALRAIVGSGMVWSLDAVGLLLLCFFVVLLPASWIDDDHVRMDIFYLRASRPVKRCADNRSAQRDRKSTRLNSSHERRSRMPSSD